MTDVIQETGNIKDSARQMSYLNIDTKTSENMIWTYDSSNTKVTDNTSLYNYTN